MCRVIQLHPSLHVFLTLSVCCSASSRRSIWSSTDTSMRWPSSSPPLRRIRRLQVREPRTNYQACQEEDIYWWFSLASQSYLRGSFPPNWPITQNNLPLFHYLDMLCVSCCLVHMCVRGDLSSGSMLDEKNYAATLYSMKSDKPDTGILPSDSLCCETCCNVYSILHQITPNILIMPSVKI